MLQILSPYIYIKVSNVFATGGLADVYIYFFLSLCIHVRIHIIVQFVSRTVAADGRNASGSRCCTASGGRVVPRPHTKVVNSYMCGRVRGVCLLSK